jgi:hypothetical protein
MHRNESVVILCTGIFLLAFTQVASGQVEKPEARTSHLPPRVADDLSLDVIKPLNGSLPRKTVSKALQFAKDTAPAMPEKIVATTLSAAAAAEDSTDRKSSAQIRRLRDGFLRTDKPDESIFRNKNFQTNMLYVLEQAKIGTRVIGGREATAGIFPNCVLIGNDTQYFCSGALISNQLVLTAGHCAGSLQPTKVLFGTSQNDPQAVEFTVEGNVERHPEYSADNYVNDLTLLILKEKVSPNIKAARIAGHSTFDTQRFKSVRLVGFGSSDRSAHAGFGVKRFGDTAVVSPDCRQPGDEKYGGHPGLEFIAGDQRVDTCNGDSGGPVFWQNGNDWLLVGTTSRWTSNHSQTCGDGGVYVRTDQYTGWIKSVAERRKVAIPEVAR